jgi:hypothetical protein
VAGIVFLCISWQGGANYNVINKHSLLLLIIVSLTHLKVCNERLEMHGDVQRLVECGHHVTKHRPGEDGESPTLKPLLMSVLQHRLKQLRNSYATKAVFKASLKKDNTVNMSASNLTKETKFSIQKGKSCLLYGKQKIKIQPNANTSYFI